MNKNEYLEALSKLLRKLPKEDREDIISDYEEHFAIGLEKGRTEEEISKALGNPKNVAKQIKADNMVKIAQDKPSIGSIIGAILATMGLGLFNLAGIIIIFTGIYWVLLPFLHLIIPQLAIPTFINSPGNDILNILVVVLSGIGLTAGGIILVVLMAYITKWFYELMIKYLKLNLRIIKGRKRDF
ncbi:MAG: DUF1700 domain-containing protein [Methanobacterium sp.]|nr:DUF1700 domain-containing protein [Methanobacterium sp.]